MPEVKNITSLPFMEQPFRAAFEQSDQGMALITPDGRWMEVNESLCRITGYTRQELTELSIRQILFETDTEGDQQHLHALTEGNLRNVRVEKRVVHKDGHFIWVSATVSVIKGAAGQPLFFAVRVEDIDERKKARLTSFKKEQAFQSLFEQNPDAVFIVDLQGHFTCVNDKAVLLAECSREELLTRNFAEFCEPQGLACILNNFPMAEKGVSFHFETGIVTAKGNHRDLKVTNMPVVIDGRIEGVCCVAKDITGKMLERQERALSHRIARLFESDAGLKECIEGALTELCSFLQAPVGEVWMGNNPDKEVSLYARYVLHEKETFRQEKFYIRKGEGMIGEAIEERRPVFKATLSVKEVAVPEPVIRKYDLQSAVAIPVLFQDGLMAVFAFYGKEDQKEWSRLKLEFFIQLAGNIYRKKKEDNLNRFFTLSSDLLCVLDFEGFFRKTNEAVTHMLGDGAESLTSKSFLEFIHSEDRVMVGKMLTSLTKNDQTLHFENRYVLGDETVKWIAWTFTSSGSEEFMYGVGRDVTEEKKTEQALRREKQRFSDMFYEAPVTMCIMMGPDLVLESANDLYLKFTGRNINSLGKSIREAFPEVEGQGIFELIRKVYETGESYSEKERLVVLDRKGDGRLEDVYLSFLYQPFYNEEGKIEGVFFFGVDVTEQVHARKKIEESRKQYVELIQNLPAAVYTCDVEGFIQLYNRAAIALWGREPEIGKERWTGALKIFDAEGNALPFELSALAQSLKERRPVRGREYQVERPDGSMRHVVSFPSPVFDTEGRLTGGVNVLIDVTERKRADEELAMLSLIARKTVNAVLLTDPEGRIEWVNEAFSRLTGYGFDEVVGKTPDFLYGEKTDPRTVEYIIQQQRRQEPFACEILKYTKSGQPFWVEKEAQPLFDVRGRLTRYFEIETDITERIRVYEQLVRKENEVRNFARQLNNMLEEERSRIAREIHDEFGQQLTGLKMSLSSLLHLPVLDDRARGIVSDMMADIENSIRSLRSFATELRPGILDTLGLVPSIKWLGQEFEKKTGIDCKVSISVERQIFDPGISIAFFRICQEALTNISKHAQASSVVIEMVQTGGHLSITIADNGKGIRAEKLEDTLSMGLIGMRERARLIGGYLKIKTNNKQGTTVHLIVKVDE